MGPLHRSVLVLSDEDPNLLVSHKVFLSVGHDEYRSWAMRDHVERARDSASASASSSLRVQQREDGPTIDQIVLSADTF
jgi:hypothetical protein